MLEVIILNYKPISKILLITIGFLIVFSWFWLIEKFFFVICLYFNLEAPLIIFSLNMS